MAENLDPVIRAKLAQFGGRWQRLMLLRGACCAVITFLGALLLAATMDWMFILPEPARWALTGLVYVGTLAVIAGFCVKPLFRRPDQRFLARRIEKECPELREKLLAAVELSESGATAAWDSPEFRKLVQTGVVEQLVDLRMENLLPPKLIAIWIRVAAAVVLCCALLSGWGDGRQLFARALAPLANLDRVSRTKIEIVEPNPPEVLAPLGDNLPVVVKITGPDPEKVWIEIQPLGGRSDRVQMSAGGAGQFTASIPVGAESLQYRIRAGDGITRMLTVRSQSRPHVTRFGKTFHFPDYTMLPPTTVNEDTGDIKILEGTEVALKLDVNQPVKHAELRIVEPGATNRIQLTEIAPQVLGATVPVKVEATYTVHLVAADTGFENKFSPSYEIRPLPDLIPRVSLEQPKDESVVGAEEVVVLQGTASDDIGLADVKQLFQVNGAAWTEVPLTFEGRTNATLSQKWDLLQLGVAPGDHLITKLVATDLKGSRAESSPVRLTISAAGFDPSRVRGLLAARVVLNALDNTSRGAAEFSKNVPPATAQRFASMDEVQRKQLFGSASTGLEDIDRALDTVTESVKEALKGSRPGRESSDLALVSRVVSRLKHERVEPLRAEVESLSTAAAAKGDSPALKRILTGGAELAQLTARVAGLFREIHSADEGDVLLENLGHLVHEQERVLKQAAGELQADPATWQRLQRRESAAAKETTVAEGMMREFQGGLPAAQAVRAEKSLTGLAAGRAKLEKAATIPNPDKILATRAGEFQRVVTDSLQQLRPLTAELNTGADKARAELAALAGNASTQIEQLRKDSAALAAVTAKGTEAAKAEARETLQRDWQAAIAELRDRARIEESRRDSSPQFVADATTAAHALSQLRSAAAAADPKDTDATLQRLEQSLNAVEAAAHLAELDAGLKSLARQERWDQASVDAATARPKDAAWLANQLQASAAEMKSAALPEAAVNTVAQAAAANENATVQKEMAARQTPDRAPKPLREPLEKLAAAVQQAQRESQAAVNTARAELAATAPKLSDQLAGMARTAEQLQKAVDAAAQPAAAATAAEPRKLLEQQADLNRQVQDALETIRRDANVQDMTKAEGRERARDADDAVAMLREPPPKVADALRQATAATNAVPRSEALADAAKQEQKLAGTLQQLAKHFANAEAGKPEETRAALRQAEAEMGLKSALDEQYAQAGKLAEMLNQTPEQMLAQLEQELARNQVMRQELQAIARDTLTPAREALQQAAQLEKKLADDLARAGKGGEEAKALGEQAKQLSEQARELVAKQLPQMNKDSTRSRADADPELARAEKALQNAAAKAPIPAEELMKDAAAAAKQMAALVKPLQQASQDFQTTATKAADAVTIATQQSQADAGKALAANAEQAAKQAADLAQKAAELGRAIDALPPGTPELAMAQAASKQAPLASELAASGAEMQRAARHESRLGTAQGEALQKVGEATQAVAAQQIPTAQAALAQPGNTAAAQAAVQEAAMNLEKQMSELAAALSQPAIPKPAADAAMSPASPEQSKWMARALDRLDAQMNGAGALGADKTPGAPADGKPQPGQPGQPGGDTPGKAGDPGTPPGAKPGNEMGAGKQGGDSVSEALAAAAQEQMASMRSARAGGQVPGEANSTPTGRGDGSGSPEGDGNFNPAALPQLPGMQNVNWAKLPPKVAQGLIEARRETVAAEYRNQVDAYFRVIADKAREAKR